jgi:hypothetical protein
LELDLLVLRDLAAKATHLHGRFLDHSSANFDFVNFAEIRFASDFREAQFRVVLGDQHVPIGRDINST